MLDGQGADEMFAGYNYYRGFAIGGSAGKRPARESMQFVHEIAAWPEYVSRCYPLGGLHVPPFAIGHVAASGNRQRIRPP